MSFGNIVVIVPMHKIEEKDIALMTESYNSVVECRKLYSDGKLIVKYVVPKELVGKIEDFSKVKEDCGYLVNEGQTDFCSQINFAVKNLVNEFKYFSILEYDDTYRAKWFKMASDYYYSNENVSVFLPVNIIHNGNGDQWQYGNELPLAGSFSKKIGFIDFECLENCSTFNLTGGIISSEDFIAVGGFKPSIKIAFNYELLLRMTKKELGVMIVPKEGYVHTIGREGSLTDIYMKTIPNEEIPKWFELANREYKYQEDRNKGISKAKAEEVK